MKREIDTQKKIGSYSTADISTNWMSTPITTKQKKTKKLKDVAHPIFLELSELCNDNVWKMLFLKASTDKFPQYFSFNNNTLFFKKRSKIEKLEISEINIDIIDDIKNFFKQYGGLYDDENEFDIFEYLTSRVEIYTSWSQIRGKKKKDYFISRYINKLNETYSLSSSEKKELHDLVYFGLCLKIIDTCNIKLENMEIENIDNLLWNPSSRKFTITGEPKYKKTNRKRTAPDKIPKNSCMAMWLKYVSKITGKQDILDEISSPTLIEDTTDTTTII
jgi:hypothetical protein